MGGIDAGGGQAGSSGNASFQQLYSQSFAPLYDFALRVLRDREEAALAVQSAYLAVYQELQAGETYPSFEVQLFAAAHRDITERLRRRRGPPPEGAPEEAFDTPDSVWASDPAVAGEAPELARIVWQVASAARPDELEPLDLQVRQGLNDEELAAVLRTRPETVRQRLGRLQAGLEDSFSALLLSGRGRRACVDLDFLVGDESWSMSVRRRVLKHLQTCQICRRTRMSYPPAANVYAALQPVEAPRGWQEAMLDRLRELAGGSFGPVAAAAMAAQRRPPPPPPPSTTQRTGAAVVPPPGPVAPPVTTYGGGGLGSQIGDLFASGDARGPLLAMLLGAMLVVVIVLAALCGAGAFGGGDDGGDGTTTPAPTITRTGSPTPTRTPTLTRTPTSAPVVPTDTPVPTQAPPPATSTSPPPPPPTNTSPPPPPTSTQPPVVTPPP